MQAASPVSICLVTYNRANLLAATIESILSQSYSDFELVISDDCSTDNTKDVCLEYVRRDPRIRYRRNSANLGMPGNLNISLQVANGRYLANLHDGDVYRRDLIFRWKEALDDHPTAAFVFNAYSTRREDGSEVLFRDPFPPLIRGRELGARLLSRWDSCVFGTVMSRREVYGKLGWFDPIFGNYSDVDMWLRMAREYDVAYVDEPLIDLMPGDPTRFYAFVHWKVLFWLSGIHRLNLCRYIDVLPGLVKTLERKFGARRRKLFIREMLVCLKHRRWDRVGEGLAIWRDADDVVLKSLGNCFGDSRFLPDWYDRSYWDLVSEHDRH